MKPWWAVSWSELASLCVWLTIILLATVPFFGPPDWWAGPIVAASLWGTRYVLWRIQGRP